MKRSQTRAKAPLSVLLTTETMRHGDSLVLATETQRGRAATEIFLQKETKETKDAYAEANKESCAENAGAHGQNANGSLSPRITRIFTDWDKAKKKWRIRAVGWLRKVQTQRRGKHSAASRNPKKELKNEGIFVPTLRTPRPLREIFLGDIDAAGSSGKPLTLRTIPPFIRFNSKFTTSIDELLCDLAWLHSGSEKDLAQRNAEGAEKRQKDFNHGSNGFNGWNFVHRPQREIKRKGAGNAKPRRKRGFEHKKTKETKIGKNFAKNAEFSDIALRHGDSLPLTTETLRHRDSIKAPEKNILTPTSIRRFFKILLVVLVLAQAADVWAAGSRIKDLAMVSGARDNQLAGYGLVAGLAGDGDKNPIETIQTIANLLQRYGLTVPATTLSSKNVAIVMVTADIPAFMKPGARLDVTVSSLGDAKTLQGGVLVQTPLLGADGKVYAVAQGPLSIGGLSGGNEGAGGASVQKNHPTVGSIAGGALVEREIPATILSDNHLELLLRDPDFTSASRMAIAINDKYPGSSLAVDSTTVRVGMPANWSGSTVDFVSDVETLEVTPDVPARVVINERTGTIVATARIHISNCAVSHGNVTISIASTEDVSQPGAFSQGGTTQLTTRTDTKIKEDKGSLVALPELPTVEKVASALNALGVTPRDMMSMFEAMKQAGALQAELIMR